MSSDPNSQDPIGHEAALAPDLLRQIVTRRLVDAFNVETEPLRRRGRDRFLVGLLIFFLGLACGAVLIAVPFLMGLRSAIP